MAEVVESVRRVTDIMAEITAASVEQSAGIAEVSRNIVEMDQGTSASSSSTRLWNRRRWRANPGWRWANPLQTVQYRSI
jgi:hypothetical protein